MRLVEQATSLQACAVGLGTAGKLPQAWGLPDSMIARSPTAGPETAMNLQQRNQVHLSGDGPVTLMFAHGFGCDQHMWRFLQPMFADRFRTLVFDQVGSGASDLSAYDPHKYDSLDGYACDVLELLEHFVDGPAIFVGHSVSAMTGVLAGIRAPERFLAHVMVGPSPCYINDGDYVGGFTRADIDSLLETMESNYLGWSSNMAPAIMGVPERPELGRELTNSFCRTDPDIARQFARVTFLSDHRDKLPLLQAPTLILQCSDDLIAPRSVGDYMSRTLPNATLRVIENHGHCPHMSAPDASARAIDDFLRHLLQ
jgi:sigma-B regulation protein RsbQ